MKPYANGKVHVKAEMCSTCIFRPGDLMHLQPGRVKEMVDDALAADTAIICHDTLYRDEQEAVCRGFWDKYDTFPLRLARVLSVQAYVE